VVDAVRARVVRALLTQIEAARQLLVDRGRKPLDLLGLQLARKRERRQLGAMEDLVRPGPADSGDHPLVAQQGMQPPGLARHDLAEPLPPESERLRAEVCELLLRLLPG